MRPDSLAAVSEVAEYVEALWRDGVGPDDGPKLRKLLAQTDDDPARDELRLFGCWYDLLNGVRAEVPAISGPVETLIVHKAAELMTSRLARDPVAVDAAMVELAELLDRSADDRPHFAAARAWADLALGEVALAVSDLETARARFEALSEPSSPIALRITALLKTASVAMDRRNVEPARYLVREATKLAEANERPLHAERARIGWGLLDSMSGDMPAMRKTLKPLIKKGAIIPRILLAGTEKGHRAMQLLADGIREATERNDPFAYLMCILIGARRYVVMGRDADALLTITAGITQLTQVAPPLAKTLVDERAEWRRNWGELRYNEAERRALLLLAPS
ncbi:MAG: hypothetical protein JWO36_6337 [Myxococcales bacterium]|nr:hypothetical protein [Myxococcales bacterium]